MPDAPRVFISYSHDDAAHEDSVLALADRLRADGIDAEIDQYEMSPPDGWPAWCERQIKKAHFVLLVCTETYLRRVDSEEEPGKGHGVLWEARIIRQLLYDEGSTTAKFVPVLFADGKPDHIPTSVKGAARFVVDTPDEYEALCRLLTNQPRALKPELGPARALPPRDRRSAVEADPSADGAAGHSRPAAPAAPATPAEPASQAARLFVGRGEERKTLAVLLLAPGRLPIVVSGMAGVGKTYLVDRVFAENREKFPGGYVRLSLDPQSLPSVDELLAQIVDRLKLPGTEASSVLARLQDPLTLLHLENIDTSEAGRLAGDLAAVLPQAALVFSARLRGLGTASGRGQVALDPFGDDDAQAQLRAEVGGDAQHQQDWPELAAALGRLPLALHLAAGYLKHGGETPASFLKWLRAKGLALPPYDANDPAFRERSKALLSATFDLSLAALRRDGEAAGEAWERGLLALGWAAAAGVGESLGAAIADLDDDAFADMARAAARLSLLERLARPDGPAFRLHPLLAELGRSRANRDAAIAQMSDWFCARLPLPGAGEQSSWNEVHAETPALLDWLAQVPVIDRARVERAGSWFAVNTGPFHAWLRFCEVALADELEHEERSNMLWTLGNVALKAGLLDRALAAAEEKQEVDRRRGDDREAALATGLIADIFESRGDLDEALRIRREKELPVYERLGDVRERSVTQRKVADILEARGELAEALRLLQEDALPAVKQLGLDRDVAVFQGRIADILQLRGELDEALRIRKNEQLPVYERLGEVRERAVTMGKIADILQMRGQPEKALQIFKKEVLPVCELIGEAGGFAVTLSKIANIIADYGDRDSAIETYRNEVIPAFVHLGEARMLVIERGWLAKHLLCRNRDSDRQEAHRLLCLALADARRMRIPEAQRIEAILAEHGLACDEPPAAAVP